MGLGKNIKNIAEEFEKLLNIDESSTNYTFHIDKEQGIFISPSNNKTKEAMKNISREQYKPIFEAMEEIRREVEYGEGYNLRRWQIF
jgi:hypothetical protein